MTDKQSFDQDENKNTGSQQGLNETIVPIDFTPASESGLKETLKLNPVRITIVSVLVFFIAVAWFILSAKSIFLDVNPIDNSITLNKPLSLKIGPRYLVRKGTLPISIQAEGYYDFDAELEVSDEQAQTFAIEMLRLPGFLTIDTPTVSNAEIIIDGISRGLTPLNRIELSAGEHIVVVEKERYESVESLINIEGRSVEQNQQFTLLEAWADISINSQPIGATVSVDGIDVGVTPLTTEILQGEHAVRIKLPAHKAWSDDLLVNARENFSLPLIELEEADGLVYLQSNPSNASVTVDGYYQGQTPLEVNMSPGSSHKVTFFLNGYDDTTRTLLTHADEETSLTVDLQPQLSRVQINTQPNDAQLFVNGELKGSANQTIELLAATQLIEVKLEGYVSYQSEFISRPGLEQQLNIRLKSLEQQRIDSIKPVITTSNGQSLKLLYPGTFVMGASRREAGRQANEVLRDVQLTTPFYLSLTEVTNAQFAQFDSEHSSGTIERKTLSNSDQPVVKITWLQAARYCNWLSEQESLEPFYRINGDNLNGVNEQSTGYRLPTEAEWAWAARVDGSAESLLKFPWGSQLPPPENHGNYADISAASTLGRILSNYNDSFLGTAPVASFQPNSNGFYDMGGNVAEWVHDYYGTTGLLASDQTTNPYGPQSGNYHVVRGSSWAHGTVTELRLSYRDYSNESRDDIGFRIARTLEE